jgi:hypothetical protein
MKKPFIKFFDKIIVILLFSAGVFASCKEPEPDYPTMKYGMPVPEYGVLQSEFLIIEKDELSDISKECISENIELENE